MNSTKQFPAIMPAKTPVSEARSGMRVAFVYPDFESLGVEYLMAACQAEGYETAFFYYESEDVFLAQKKVVDFRKEAATVADWRPHVVAFSCVTDNYRNQLEFARVLKEIRQEIVTLFGGVHVSIVPDRVLANREVDCVAVGEADGALRQLLRQGKCGDRGFQFPDKAICGTVFKRDGKIVGDFQPAQHNDLDGLPFLDKTQVYAKIPGAALEYRTMTGRGCPFRCSYCFNSYWHKVSPKPVMRRRSPGNVIEELKEAKTRYSPGIVRFLDDCFTTDVNWLHDFCARYKSEIGLDFTCITHPHLVSGDVARTLKESGCVWVEIGIQTLSPEIFEEVLDRKTDTEKISGALDCLRANGIPVQVDHMLGIPGDTLEIQEKSLLFYNSHRPYLIGIYWLTYYPGTAILKIAERRGLITAAESEALKDGVRVRNGSVVAGGDMTEPGRFLAVAFIMNWLPFLPRFVVKFLVSTRLYRVFRTGNYWIVTVLPRVLRCLIDRRDIRGRYHVKRFLKKLFGRNTH